MKPMHRDLFYWGACMILRRLGNVTKGGTSGRGKGFFTSFSHLWNDMPKGGQLAAFPTNAHTNTFLRHVNSIRQRRNPRDFMFAIMFQYGLYTVPPKAWRMGFAEMQSWIVAN